MKHCGTKSIAGLFAGMVSTSVGPPWLLSAPASSGSLAGPNPQETPSSRLDCELANEVPLQLPPELEAMIEYDASMVLGPLSETAPPLLVLRPTVAKISDT